PGTVRPVIGTRPTAPTVMPRPVANPNGTVRPVIGTRPTAPTVMPRPMVNPEGMTRPVIGTRPVSPAMGNRPIGSGGYTPPISRGTGPGMMPRTFGAGGMMPSSNATRPGTVAKIVRPTIAAPYEGGMAPAPRPGSGRLSVDARNVTPLGQRAAKAAAPESATKAKPQTGSLSRRSVTPPRARPTRLPGQRVKPFTAAAEASSAERAVVRGATRSSAASRGPGQEVFAKFAARKAAADTTANAKVSDTNADEAWHIGLPTVPPVITGKREPS
ncbi:MAG: hypothetical protein ACRD0P_36770, partial [Stackebrandtia sp.]